MPARLFAFVIWAVVAFSAVAWGLGLLTPTRAVPLHTVPVAEGHAARGDVLRVLGREATVSAPTAAAPVASAEASRFRLLGVVTPRGAAEGSGGLALIAVDGKPARPVRVGAVVHESWVLHSVDRRGASLGLREGPATVTLEVPPLPVANRGTLPPGGAPNSVAPAPPQMAPPPSPQVQQPVRGAAPGEPVPGAASAPTQ